MGRFDMGPLHDFADLVCDQLNMILCLGFVLAGLWHMGVWSIEFLP